MRKEVSMGKVYNSLDIRTENLADSHIQKYEPNTPYSFKEQGHYYLFYVKNGQIQIVSQKNEFLVQKQQVLIVYCEDIVHLFVSFSQADVMVLHFGESSGNLLPVTGRITDIHDSLLSMLASIEYRLNIIYTIKSSKPSILYDKEIGNYFNVTSSLLYATLDNFLLMLIEQLFSDALPEDIRFDYLSKARRGILYGTFSTQNSAPAARTPQKHIYKNQLVNQVIKYMNNNLGANLSIDEIAAEFLLGPSNLKRIFKKETGQSIIHYFHVLKMEAAQTLIIKNEKSYTEIASLLGFNSVHHFSTAFKKYTGYSPSKFYQITMMK